ncbi:MAG TPA: beta-ketoacyl synthase N-terminal-like domain-containing protein, partial [Thermoanaerobaculia bacterium]|nr:beta-ketoacyl synthase N-terminal-like domain-containing protein [Thermoanaerobaculia bacterium]
MTDRENTTGIAVIGMAGRFPGASTLDQFWRNLADGVESISFFGPGELAAAGIDPARVGDRRYVPARGVLAGAERFDAAFFGLTPKEAELMDPQHRILLECAWEALEQAGQINQGAGGRTAVFAGAGLNSYLLHNLLPNRELLANVGELQAILLNNNDFLATRISYKLDLRGPSALVQTACSTGLMAVHVACQSLLGGECDLALAGAVSITFPQRAGYLHQEGGVMSPDGHCRAFDARAGGAVEGAGAGMVVLKRLAEALADGDFVHAVIRGSAANNDGAGKVGFTAPSVGGQAEVIRESLLMADVDPGTVTYVEAHGSGTPLGDPVEIAALTQAFGDSGSGSPGGRCAVGSVKTNVGHLNSAAGMAGLLKTVLALEHRAIPPSLHFTSPNPQIDFAGGPFYVNTALAPWESTGPRRAGVSSFGLGGTNVHAVLEEAPTPAPSGPARPWQLLVLSAKSATALDGATADLAKHLEGRPDLDSAGLADVAWTLQAGRRLFPHRRALVCRDAADARALLTTPDLARVVSTVEGSSGRPVVFLFPGLGDHYVDMGRELYASEPRFKEELDRSADFLAPLLGLDLREAIFRGGDDERARGAGSGTDLKALLRRTAGGEAADEALRRLSRTAIAQPALFAVEYALAQLLLSWGIRPAAMLGYSIGEYVAACLAGVMSLPDALTLVALRAQRIAELPGGAMLAVPLPEAEVRLLLGADLAVAATNGPHLTVVGGTDEAVARLEAELAGRADGGAACLRLHASHAFHTPALTPALAPLLAAARQVRLQAPAIPFLSNVSGTWITDAEATDPAYWGRHMVGTVRFAEGLAELLADPARVLLEVGPGSTLTTLARQHPGGAAGSGAVAAISAIAAMRRASDERSDAVHLLAALGRLWAAGVTIDWPAFHAGGRRRRVPLPTYPFERQRYWIDPPARADRVVHEQAGGTPALPGSPAPLASGRRTDVADWLYVPVWRETPLAPTALAGARLAREAGPWLLFLDREGVGERLAARLGEAGAEVATVPAGDIGGPGGREGYGRLLRELRAQGRFPRRIVHLGSAGAGELGFAAAQEAGLLSLVHLARAIGEEGRSAPLALLVVSSGVQAVGEGAPVEPARATLLGACRVIPQEYVHVSCRSVDATLPAPGSPAADRLTAQLLAEALASGPGRAAEVALRGRRRFARAYEPLPLGPVGEEGEAPLRRDGVYLVTDVLHGIGLPLAEALRQRFGCRLALLLPPGAEIGERLAALATSPDVLLTTADVTSVADLRAAAALARERFLALTGVFHTAAAFSGGLLQLKSPETLPAVFGAQGRGALAIVEAFADLPLDFLALAASTAAVTGGFGQVDSAAAGALLGALAEQGEGRIATFDWDPYQWDSWLAAGITNIAGSPALQAGLTGNLATYGTASEQSLEALARLLAAGLPRAVVSAQDLDAVIAQTDAFHAADLLASVTGGTVAPRASRSPRPPGAGPYVPPGDEVEAALAHIWEELFGIAPIGVEDDFLALGGHSLLAIQVTTQIRHTLGVDLPVSALFEQPTLALLARRLRDERSETGETAEAAEDLDALLAQV